MTWYKFNSMEEFNVWHESVKSILGLPYDDGITTKYTDPLVQIDGSVIAFSDEEYADNLTRCDYTPPVFEYLVVDKD